MRILLTGAEGFTGRHFAERASAKGHSVVALRSDLMEDEALRKEVLEVAPDAVVHLAAISFVGHADETAFYAVNVVGTTNLLDALTKLPTKPNACFWPAAPISTATRKHRPSAKRSHPRLSIITL